MQEIDPFEFGIANLQSIKTLADEKSPTLNGMGYVFFGTSPIIEEFLTAEARPGKVLLEIGAGYSDLTINALKKRVGSYTANDISADHLKILGARLKEAFKEDLNSKLNSLKLLCGKAPQDLPTANQVYDAVIMDKVLHFMPPHDILQFIEWAKLALKPNGRLYVTTATPYSKTFCPFLKEYLARSSQGDLFPGHFSNMMENINPDIRKQHPDYSLPSEMVIFDSQALSNLFEKKGMLVKRFYFLKKVEGIHMNWIEVDKEKSCTTQENCLLGIIVENKV